MILKLHPNDNVLIALEDLPSGIHVQWNDEQYHIPEPIPAKHKFAGRHFKEGDIIFMYGIIVGKATQDIPQGHLINTINIVHESASFTSKTEAFKWQPLNIDRWKDRSFQGYHRNDGRVGTANYWLFVPLVFCENRNLDIIREVLLRELGYSKNSGLNHFVHELVSQYKSSANGNGHEKASLSFEQQNLFIKDPERVFNNIDGIKFLFHQGGCGGTRDDARILCQLLAGYICNPNVAGATILSLGCQHAQVQWLNEAIANISPTFKKPMLVYEQQLEADNEVEFLSKVMLDTFEELRKANEIKRKPAPLSNLVVGLECGGSDGFSGITANPAMGYASDIIVSLGGSVVLSEFPELCGVEQELINRCISDKLADKFIKLQRAYAKQAEAVGSGFDMNPSPGNIRDGLITDAIKSAGAAKKGGSSPITDVLDYTEQVINPGLNLLCTPGNDVESTTGLAGSGSNLILFSTGLGTPTGNPVAPVIKISTNTKLTKRMPYMIDIDAGKILSENYSLQQMGEEILEFCIKVASGEIQTKAQQLGQDDFIPWKRGVSL